VSPVDSDVASTLACYVFGIVDADAELPRSATDAGELDGADFGSATRLVRNGRVAAVVAAPPADRPLGRAADLLAHDRVLATLAATTAVLPMRFGTVLPDEDAVVEELLAARHDELVQQLDRIRDRLQFTVKARYEEDAVLREIMATHPEITRLRERSAAGFDDQLRLGEAVVGALTQLREQEAPAIVSELGPHDGAVERAPGSPEELLNVALLIPATDVDRFVARVERLGEQHAGRIRIRLVGPSPAYDFVETD